MTDYVIEGVGFLQQNCFQHIFNPFLMKSIKVNKLLLKIIILELLSLSQQTKLYQELSFWSFVSILELELMVIARDEAEKYQITFVVLIPNLFGLLKAKLFYN